MALASPAPGTFLRGAALVEASASDAVGVTKVEFYAGTTLLGTDTTAPYQVSWNTAGMTDGAHTLTAKAFDSIGNERNSTGVQVTVDNTAPVTAVSAPAQGALLRGTVPVSATASDAVGVERVEFYAGTTLLGTSTIAPYAVSWDTTAVANGSVTLTTKAYDAVGNVTTSAARTVTVDNSAPTVAITSPANGTSFSFLTFSTTIQASASDNVGVTQVVFYDGATVLGTDTTAPYSFSWNLLGAAKGNHTLTARAHDAAGNVTTSAPITVKVN
ncbi:Ig-like domain-containing protein [Archangium violaceum]|uniref:Ig-like domain-containing protein n=1 Tax=Archangium violaceum TaxID=83451 RepID=UPI0034E205DE